MIEMQNSKPAVSSIQYLSFDIVSDFRFNPLHSPNINPTASGNSWQCYVVNLGALELGYSVPAKRGPTTHKLP